MTLLFQRPLKAQPVGKCTLDPKDKRAPRALPSAQRLRIYQEINHMEVRLPGKGVRKLTTDERDMLVDKALNTGKFTFDTARTALKLPENAVFNLESERRKDLKGDETAAVLSAKKVWGKSWRELNLSDQDAAVENLLEEQDKEKLIEWLMEVHSLEREIAEAAAKVNLPPGHGNLGRIAAGKVLAELKAADVPTYSEAVERAGYGSHSDFDDGEVFDQLPYYGEVLERHVAFGTSDHSHPPEKRFGKIANPTVHVALNQLRRTVNALMQEHGAPKQIVVELARNLPLSAVGKSELQKTQNENKARNDARRAKLAEHGQRDNYDNRMRLRLWEELNPKDAMDRCCPYTGKQISIERLFSADFEIEHVLPSSKTLDNSANNKTISDRAANRQKGDRPPYEVFSDTPGYQDRVDKMLREKRWRFGPDAMTRFDDRGGFLARHLNDTKYLSRISTAYLKRTGADVWVTPGRLTSDLRWTWGLDSVLRGHNQPQEEDSAAKKNRNDHRHHAIDAVVVGLTDRGLLNEVARAAGQAEKNFDKRYLAELEEPWADFRETVRGRIDKIVVSHKPDHGVQGGLHNDTAYGIAEGPDKKGRSVVVHRVPLSGMKKAADLDPVRDEIIKKYLQTATAGLTGKEFTDALVAAGEQMIPPVRKVRICETISVIPISDPKHHGEKPYKAYKGDANYCYDIWADGKGKWTGEVVSRFEANQSGFDTKAEKGRNGQPLIMRLRKDDMLAIEEPGATRQFMYIAHITEGKIALAEHFEANVDARDRNKEDNFSYKRSAPSTLQKLKARLVRVDPSGRVFDPGPHK
ncbi:MAG: type II CRISPR RNA-guided endonuclease Cas9 [Rhodospirillales bacterium]